MASSQELERVSAALDSLDVVDDVRSALHAYAFALALRDLPAIVDMEGLASSLNINRALLWQQLNSTKRFYRSFDIPKRTGGVRAILAPYPSLLEVQRWINRRILSKFEIHDAAYGFVRGRSIIQNAEQHLNRHALLRIDIKDFFPSIGLRRILGVFNFLGYTPTISYYLSTLCTVDGVLPQGAATSPTLSNIVARSLDLRLKGFAAACRLRYSRYADDLIFSGDRIAISTVDFIKRVVQDEGFEVNDKKTFLAYGRKKKIVTGISVGGDVLKIPKSTRRQLRQELHHIRRVGLVSHLVATRQRNPLYLESLLGKFSFWHQVEPQNEYVAVGIAYLRGVQQDMDAGRF